jgi:hypothetical protein
MFDDQAEPYDPSHGPELSEPWARELAAAAGIRPRREARPGRGGGARIGRVDAAPRSAPYASAS